MKYILFFITIFFFGLAHSQSSFRYEIQIDSIIIESLPGIHSFSFAQHDGKWLIIGGRLDGLHARQPFRSFPSNENNTDIYVIDIQQKQFWSSSVNSLSTELKEQLQSTNMNFYQDENVLYIIGGYAYSSSASDHKTFNNLVSIDVPGLIDAIINADPITSFFKYTSDDRFAVTGGQLGKIGNTFYLIGGHRFDGRYNPMGHSTYTQTYTNEIRMFEINNSGSQLSYSNYDSIHDPVHLRRRDYNLLPQIFPDGRMGYTISSGVFQSSADLPFLYPVDITSNGYSAKTSFNQYLSNYHSAKVCLFDSTENSMHSLFFGGMSQYHYEEGELKKDDLVPFVNTISRLSRSSDGQLQEVLVNKKMPGFKGASAEFILNTELAHYDSDIIKMNKFESDTVLIGHIYGGIESSMENPFSVNQTSSTSAGSTIYSISLVYSEFTEVQELSRINPYDITVFPNPFKESIVVECNSDDYEFAEYHLLSSEGKVIKQGKFNKQELENRRVKIKLPKNLEMGAYVFIVSFDNEFFVSKKIVHSEN